MSVLPGGSVTFLFTDIEGSTRLVKALREQYAEVLAGHRRLVRAAIVAHARHEVDTQGDAFFAVFGGAKQAVLCALDIQRAFAAHDWPAGLPVRVRIGIHTGQAVPAEGAYTGLAVHRAARICAAARGGQVLISQATQTLIEDEEEGELGFTLVEVGERRLKDLDRPVRLFELAAAGLDAPSAGEPVAVLAAREIFSAPGPERHGVPVPLTSLVGREDELAALDKLLGRARLVTLTGPGGAGKTRLAVEVTDRTGERYPDGVWLAELAGVTDLELVPSRVMEALGVRQTGDLPVMDALRYRLRSAELLLVLDNCEHLLDACARLAGDLLGSSAGLQVLATSREALGVAGEAVFMVPPLNVPAESADMADIALSPAVRLFADRASAARAGSDVAAAAGTIASICRALDGLPLAIELAAARVSALSVAEIEHHLGDKFRLLARRRPVADVRHQTLKAAIGWSFELLSAPERSVFRALSVFAGGFQLAEAAAVCFAGDEAAALDLIDSLVSKSLVVAEPSAAGTRYRLLETIREYAADQLAEVGEADGVWLRHAIVYLDLAERECDRTVLSGEHDNFWAALEWSLARRGDIAARLAAALGSFWLACGLYQEGQNWMERAMAAVPAGGRLVAELLRLLGAVLYAAGDLERASAVLAEGIQVAKAGGLAAAAARIAVLQVEIGSPRLPANQADHTRRP